MQNISFRKHTQAQFAPAQIPVHWQVRRGPFYVGWRAGSRTTLSFLGRNWCDQAEATECANDLNAHVGAGPAWEVVPMEAGRL